MLLVEGVSCITIWLSIDVSENEVARPKAGRGTKRPHHPESVS